MAGDGVEIQIISFEISHPIPIGREARLAVVAITGQASLLVGIQVCQPDIPPGDIGNHAQGSSRLRLNPLDLQLQHPAATRQEQRPEDE